MSSSARRSPDKKSVRVITPTSELVSSLKRMESQQHHPHQSSHYAHPTHQTGGPLPLPPPPLPPPPAPPPPVQVPRQAPHPPPQTQHPTSHAPLSTASSSAPAAAADPSRASSKKVGKTRMKSEFALTETAEDDDDDDHKKKRKRVERACFGCRQRRSKCDGMQPCSICKGYDPSKCEYPPPPRRVTMKYVEELEAKIKSLEDAPASLAEEPEEDDLPLPSPPPPSALQVPSASSSRSNDSSSDPTTSSHPQHDSRLPAPIPTPPPPPTYQPYFPPRLPQANTHQFSSNPPHYQYPPPNPPLLPQQQHSYLPSYQSYSPIPYPPRSSFVPYSSAQSSSASAPFTRPQSSSSQPPQPSNWPPKGSSNPYFEDSQLYHSPAQTQPSQPQSSTDRQTSNVTSSLGPSNSASASSYPFSHSSSHLASAIPQSYGTQLPYGSRGPVLPASSQRSTHRDEDDEVEDGEPIGEVISKEMEERTMGKGKGRVLGETDSSELEAVDQALGPGFGAGGLQDGMTVARLMDAELTAENGQGGRWERTGHEGLSTEVVENAAAKLARQEVKSSQIPAAGRPTDSHLLYALAGSPSFPDMHSLPPREIADSLMDFYHEKIHYTLPVLHWPSFILKYEQIWSWSLEDSLTASDHIILATINLTFCIVCSIRCEKDDAKDGAKYFRRSQALLSVTHILLMSNVAVIDYLLLICLYSHNCSKGNLSANAAGLAILMARGLHLHDQHVNYTFDPLERAVRTRAWAACLEMETQSAARLYRSTMTTDLDYDPTGFPEPHDDEEIKEKAFAAFPDQSKPKKIQFFIESIKLFSIKTSIFRKLYDVNHPVNFPHAQHVITLEEELLAWWQAVPDFLKVPEKLPEQEPFPFQAHLLGLRYLNARVLLYRPFLFHFCTTPNGSYPPRDSLKFNFALKSAQTCAEAAIEQISKVVAGWRSVMLGYWWLNLGLLYCASLVVLANRIVHHGPNGQINLEIERTSVAALRKSMNMLIELGWEASDGSFLLSHAFLLLPLPNTAETDFVRGLVCSYAGLTSIDGTQRAYPPPTVQSTARRCYRIILNIDRAIKSPNLNEGGLVSSAPESRKDSNATATSSKTQASVGPNRYSRRPNPSIPPLRLGKSANPFDDDNFVSSWINLMQPEVRDETFVPPSFTGPSEPFDLSTRALNQNHKPISPEISGNGWASLLGTGYLSNFGMGDTLVESGDVAAGMYGTGGGLDPFMGTDIYELGNEFKDGSINQGLGEPSSHFARTGIGRDDGIPADWFNSNNDPTAPSSSSSHFQPHPSTGRPRSSSGVAPPPLHIPSPTVARAAAQIQQQQQQEAFQYKQHDQHDQRSAPDPTYTSLSGVENGGGPQSQPHLPPRPHQQ